MIRPRGTQNTHNNNNIFWRGILIFTTFLRLAYYGLIDYNKDLPTVVANQEVCWDRYKASIRLPPSVSLARILRRIEQIVPKKGQRVVRD